MGAMNFPEKDWRLLRSLHRVGLERYCTRVLDECAMVVRNTELSPHDRYLRLARLLDGHDKSIAAAFNDMRRSTAVQRLAAMIALGVVTEAELVQFTTPTREAAAMLEELWRPRGKRTG